MNPRTDEAASFPPLIVAGDAVQAIPRRRVTDSYEIVVRRELWPTLPEDVRGITLVAATRRLPCPSS
jgi:hypothetical protein